MAMVDAHRGVRRRPCAMKTKCSVAQGKCCADTRSKCNPGQTKGLARIQCNRDYSYTRAASWSVVLNDCPVINRGITGRPGNSRSPLYRDPLGDIQPRCPAKRPRRNHDRVAIDGLIVMDRLNILYRAV